MSYIIFKTDGTVLTTIPDGTVNTTSTPLALPGRLYPGYGQVIDTDIVHLLENFADNTPPANALQGQLWFNTDNSTMYICPADGESNTSNWLTLATIDANGDAAFNNLVVGNLTATTIRANLVDTDYLTVRVQANIANANITGNTVVANLSTANITAGSNAALGNLTGAWTVNGTATLNGAPNTAMWVTGGNLLADGIKSDKWYYSNGAAISFDGNYSNANVAAYLANTAINANTLGGYTTSVSATPNTIALRDSNGNIQANYVLGNGAFLTNINTSLISNGTSNVSIASSGGNVTIGVNGTVNAAVISSTGVSVPGNVDAGNISATRISGSLTTASQPNITTVGTLSFLVVNGNLNAVNITGSHFGNGAGLTNLPGSSVTGVVANATYAVTAGTVASIPPGTKMLFVQSAAPTGWTKLTSADNAALRIVSGAAGSGGSVDFTTAFSVRTTSGSVGATSVGGSVGATAVDGSISSTATTGTVVEATASGSIASSSTGINIYPSYVYLDNEQRQQYALNGVSLSDPGHAHAFTPSSHSHGFTGSSHTHSFSSPGHSHSFSSPSHDHTFSGSSINLSVKYVDAIIAQKD